MTDDFFTDAEGLDADADQHHGRDSVGTSHDHDDYHHDDHDHHDDGGHGHHSAAGHDDPGDDPRDRSHPGSYLPAGPTDDHGAADGYARFDPDRDGGVDVAGDPAADMEQWHEQVYLDGCDVSCEEFILNALGTRHYTEQDLVRESYVHKWYGPGGTPQQFIGAILHHHGVPVRQEFSQTLPDIVGRLEHGEKVIVGVQTDALDGSGADPMLAEVGIPSVFATHAVQVIGVKGGHTDHPVVILNDPGRPDGAGLMVPADQFERAWAPSGHFMVTTAVKDEDAAGAPPLARFGRHHDADGSLRPAAGSPRFGEWVKSAYTDTLWERASDGTYTGNWSH